MSLSFVLKLHASLAVTYGVVTGKMKRRAIQQDIELFKGDAVMEPIVLQKYKSYLKKMPNCSGDMTLEYISLDKELQNRIVKDVMIKQAGTLLMWPILAFI